MLYHRHSLVVPYNESNADLIGLDENQLLTGYHGGSLYTRAAQTNDSSVINLPFDASLVFVQNLEPFSIGAVKERVKPPNFSQFAFHRILSRPRQPAFAAALQLPAAFSTLRSCW